MYIIYTYFFFFFFFFFSMSEEYLCNIINIYFSLYNLLINY
ncbi:hypothetical protein PFMC_03020 [Plasmodium falciparum CAMP/Malaysia]|uniref:Uncharacterized protein n=1 Tax=Plasmodium falciparum (isolate Camp / Malaysia) TaxID=5835 RepID=A0A024X6N5_PLAFC|nr:hypothetical protein PFMC_03020 [Plasmodium falciparum CAMP/Malaysia]